MDQVRLTLVGISIVFLGFFVVLAGALTSSGGSGSTGGFILIGPIPIVFGSGPNSGMLALLGVVLTFAVVVVYLVALLRMRRASTREHGV